MKTIGVIAGAAALAATLTVPAAAYDGGVGERVFQTQCASCHSLSPGETLAGPSLSGIGQMRPAAVPSFDYSDGMRSKSAEGVVWDAGTLDAFLADPRSVVPGTRHTIEVPNPDLRRELVDYLLQAR